MPSNSSNTFHYLETGFPIYACQDSTTNETIDKGSASIAEGYNYCTFNWQVEEGDSLLSSPIVRRSRRHLQIGDDYTAPVIPAVIPVDVEEVCMYTHTQVSF